MRGRSETQGPELMLLEVSELAVDVATPRGFQRVVDRTSFSIAEGESLGVVGESGSGKTMTALALMGLITHREWLN